MRYRGKGSVATVMLIASGGAASAHTDWALPLLGGAVGGYALKSFMGSGQTHAPTAHPYTTTVWRRLRLRRRPQPRSSLDCANSTTWRPTATSLIRNTSSGGKPSSTASDRMRALLDRPRAHAAAACLQVTPRDRLGVVHGVPLVLHRLQHAHRRQRGGTGSNGALPLRAAATKSEATRAQFVCSSSIGAAPALVVSEPDRKSKK